MYIFATVSSKNCNKPGRSKVQETRVWQLQVLARQLALQQSNVQRKKIVL
jgi:hypothetical protein